MGRIDRPLITQYGLPPPASLICSRSSPLPFVVTVNVRWVNWPAAVETFITLAAPLVIVPKPAGTVTLIMSRAIVSPIATVTS
jgi:hypothetical protein